MIVQVQTEVSFEKTYLAVTGIWTHDLPTYLEDCSLQGFAFLRLITLPQLLASALGLLERSCKTKRKLSMCANKPELQKVIPAFQFFMKSLSSLSKVVEKNFRYPCCSLVHVQRLSLLWAMVTHESMGKWMVQLLTIQLSLSSIQVTCFDIFNGKTIDPDGAFLHWLKNAEYSIYSWRQCKSKVWEKMS